MKALAYTGIHQMTHLFLETFRGEMGNNVVNDSLQPFVVDLHNAIENSEKEREVLNVVQECIVEYYSPLIESSTEKEVYICRQIQFLNETLERLGLKENTNVAVFLEEILTYNFKENEE